MKAICIDDEKLVLDYLVKQLNRLGNIEVVGTYNQPLEGLEHIFKEDIDIAFLDINMPEIRGIELASEIGRLRPNTAIVFVTAYEQFAVDAFHLDAVDYLVKPIRQERLRETIKRVEKRLAMIHMPTENETIYLDVKVSDYLAFSKNNGVYEPLTWRTTKAEELFLYLLQNGGKLVDKYALKEVLWEDIDMDDSLLHTTVYNVRKTIRDYKQFFKLRFKRNSYFLEIHHVRIDLFEWENQLVKLGPVTNHTIKEYEKVMRMNTAPYLNYYSYIWLEAERQRLEQLWTQKVYEMSHYYESIGDKAKAFLWCNEMCERNQEDEEAHFLLMKYHAENKDYRRLATQYEKLTHILKHSLDVEPSNHIQAWYDSIIVKLN